MCGNLATVKGLHKPLIRLSHPLLPGEVELPHDSGVLGGRRRMSSDSCPFARVSGYVSASGSPFELAKSIQLRVAAIT